MSLEIEDDFFAAYFKYTAATEAPRIFHRWCAIAGIGALLAKNFYFPFGAIGNIYPNIYCMLLGEPGTKKSTAIKMMVKLLLKSGYHHIGPNETTKEKFLEEMQEGINYYAREELDKDVMADDILDSNLFGTPTTENHVSECLVAADEFNGFIGYSNIPFISTLGDLWDYDGIYKKKLKNSKSVFIVNPIITILGGNTATNYAEAFPTNVLGQGFFSRLLHVHGEETGIKITRPEMPPDELLKIVLSNIATIRNKISGEAKITPAADILLDKIYKSWAGLDDVRFKTYSNRRFTHLIKLVLIHTAARFSTTIDTADVVYANTVLSYTEHFMPKALGEFGKAEHSDVVNKIMALIDSSTESAEVVTMKTIWIHVHKDLNKFANLGEILRNLVVAERIQQVGGGFLAKKQIMVDTNSDLIDYNLLTIEEKEKR